MEVGVMLIFTSIKMRPTPEAKAEPGKDRTFLSLPSIAYNLLYDGAVAVIRFLNLMTIIDWAMFILEFWIRGRKNPPRDLV